MASDPDRASATLAAIRERYSNTNFAAAPTRDRLRVAMASSADVPLLLVAVERVLELHAPYSTTTRHLCPVHAVGMRDRSQATLRTYRDEVDACPDCRKEEVRVCTECRNACPDDDEWPCPTHRAITAALVGDDESDPPQTEADRRAADEALTALRDRLGRTGQESGS